MICSLRSVSNLQQIAGFVAKKKKIKEIRKASKLENKNFINHSQTEEEEIEAKKFAATLPGGAKPRRRILEYIIERDRFKKQYPLITAADKTNDRKALYRKLTNRLYLIVSKDRNQHQWQFPQGEWEEKDGMHLRKV